MLCSLTVTASVAVGEEERAIERRGLNGREKERGGCSIKRRHQIRETEGGNLQTSRI